MLQWKRLIALVTIASKNLSANALLKARRQPFQGGNSLILLVVFFISPTWHLDFKLTLQFKHKTIISRPSEHRMLVIHHALNTRDFTDTGRLIDNFIVYHMLTATLKGLLPMTSPFYFQIAWVDGGEDLLLSVTRKSCLFAKKTSDLLPCLAKTIIFWSCCCGYFRRWGWPRFYLMDIFIFL